MTSDNPEKKRRQLRGESPCDSTSSKSGRFDDAALFDLIKDSVRDAIIMLDHNGKVTLWNAAAEQIFGYREDEVMGKDIHEILISEKYHKAYLKAFAHFQKTGQGNAIDKTSELEAYRKDGQEIAIELSLASRCLHDKYHSLGIVRDVTERKKAEEELRKSEHRFRVLHDASFGGIAIHDKGIILDCNQGLADISGYSLNELIGKDGLLLIAERSRKGVMGKIMSGYEKPYDVVGLRKDGSEYPVRLMGKNIPYGNTSARVVEFRDISDQVKMRQEQEVLQKQLLQSQKVESIGRLAGGVAHDLNNLLSPILGYSELLMENLNIDEASRRQLSIILDAAYRSRDLVRQLLAFSRKQTLQVRPVDINRVIKNLKKLLRRIISENICIESALASEDCVVLADVNQIEQVLINLSINAADAMPEGGVLKIGTTIVTVASEAVPILSAKAPGQYVLLSVSDTGRGMSDDILQQIFEPFFSTKGELGTGLGLATVYGIIKQHDGNIEVESEPGKGSCFNIYLPFSGRECVETVETEKAKEGDARRGSENGESILIVEDNEHVRQLASIFLQMDGYRVLTAKDGKDALEKVHQGTGKIDVLLTDVVLPGMNGRVLSEKMKRIIPGLKTLYMSGYPAEILSSEAMQDAGILMIQKPFTRAVLMEKIRFVLER